MPSTFGGNPVARAGPYMPSATRDGRPMRPGNRPDIDPGPEDTFSSYGPSWANLSNAPFRRYKRWVHEGGIATPCIIHFADGEPHDGTVLHTPFQLVDFVPTVLELTGVTYPDQWNGNEVTPFEGRSMLSALRGVDAEPAPLYWEHIGNAAIRVDRWKLVRENTGPWELYDMKLDRAELKDISRREPGIVQDLLGQWEAWAERIGVIPWDTVVDIYEERGLTAYAAAGSVQPGNIESNLGG